MPAASWIGFRATTICIVEQFGLAMMPLWPSRCVGVDLGDDERHVLVHPEAARVVDHRRPGGDEPAAPTRADRAAGGEEGEVEPSRPPRRGGAPRPPRRRTAAGARPSARRRAGAPRRPGSRAPRGSRGRSRRRRRWRRRPRPCRRARAVTTRPSRRAAPFGRSSTRRRRTGRRARTPRAGRAPRPATRSPRDHAGDLDRRGRDHLDVDARARRASRRPSRRRPGGCACRRRRSRPCRSRSSVVARRSPSFVRAASSASVGGREVVARRP